ncbi:MAG: thioredoxin family protein [bacterium]
MKFRALILSLLLAAPAMALDLGATAPKADVKMKNVDGRELTITEIAGKQGTLVIFTCNHCPWAKAWEERIAALGNTYAARGVGVIAINANDPKANAIDGFGGMVERAKTRDFKFPYVVDSGSAVARAFGAERTPEAFVFDAQGKLVYHGTIDDNAEHASDVKQPYLKNALEAVSTGKSVEVQETKSIGCGIKYYES